MTHSKANQVENEWLNGLLAWINVKKSQHKWTNYQLQLINETVDPNLHQYRRVCQPLSGSADFAKLTYKTYKTWTVYKDSPIESIMWLQRSRPSCVLVLAPSLPPLSSNL